MLPAQNEMGEFSEDPQEAAAVTLSKPSRAVAFSYTPASKHMHLAELVTGPVGVSVHLAAHFKEEGSTDKADLFSEDLEAMISEEWVEGDEGENTSFLFSLTVCFPVEPACEKSQQTFSRVG
jgi:hypothetical protein